MQGSRIAAITRDVHRYRVYATIKVDLDGSESTDFTISKTSVLLVALSFIVLMVLSVTWLVFYYVQRFRYLQNKERFNVSFMHTEIINRVW